MSDEIIEIQPTDTGESIKPVLIQDEMKNSYIDYAMSVIVGRALPDARDGFKPVHRRILYAMNEAGITSDKAYKKSARVVGDVLGKYHPHGDSAVYESLVRMVQDFSLRYPLIDGQGNFGSIDGDSAAAMRYTECRMDKISNEMLADIGKETVLFKPNYDGSLKEPSVLPAKLPNLLINGSTGIAVGMATNMAPHNLGEVIDGTLKVIEDPNVTIEELMSVIKAPDFPTAGTIIGMDEVRKAYRTGRGKIKIRAVTSIEEMKNDKNRIVISELPYQVNKSKLIESIASLARDKRIVGISDLRDESDRNGIRVVIELTRNTNPDVVLNQLFKNTNMEVTFGIINLALVDGVPMELNLKELLEIYLKHRIEVILRRSEYDLRKTEEKTHILKGLLTALDHIDEVIKLIRGSQNVEEARTGLIENFDLDEIQAKAILDMRLQKLTGLEREKIENEHSGLVKFIAELKSIIASDEKKYEIIKEELQEIRDRFADKRRTKIEETYSEIEDESLIPKEDVVVTITNQGYIKRNGLDAYKQQHRGGKGIIGMDTKEEDFVENIFVASTHDYLTFFTSHGKVLSKKIYDIPQGSRQAKGKAIVNFLDLKDGDTITAMIPVEKFDEDKYLFMATKFGTLKKCQLSDFAGMRKGGIVGIKLVDGDELVNVALTDGTKELIMVSRYGKAVRFSETDVRSMGRTAKGVRGIKLDDDDFVVSLDVVDNECKLLAITENGYGKRTTFDEYRAMKRGGKGVITIITNLRNGFVSNVKSVHDDDEVMVTSSNGIIIRMPVKDIRVQGRNTQGVKIMDLKNDDKVVSVARIESENEE